MNSSTNSSTNSSINTIWQMRPVQSNDIAALSSLLAQATLEAIDPAEQNCDDQWLVALPITASTSGASEPSILGCIRIRRNIGLAQPRYWYHVGSVVHAAPDLGLFHRQQTLLLGNDHTGCTELSDICTSSQQLAASQQSMLTRLLIKAALLRVQQDSLGPQNETRMQSAAMAQASADRVIVGLPGLSDCAGVAPFWQGLGRHFYTGDVRLAQARFGEAWLSHVAALLPRHPLVASLLDESAQAAIGAMHADANLLCEVLIEAGMRAGEHVSLYDAGPVYEGHTALLRELSGACQRRLVLAEQWEAGGWYLLAGDATNYPQLCLLPACVNAQGELQIRAADAQRLGLRTGAQVLAEAFRI